MTARERLQADFARYHYIANIDNKSLRQRFRVFRHQEAMWAIATYRFGQFLQFEASTIYRLLLHIPYIILSKIIQYTLGIHISTKSDIGPGLYIGHYGGIWVNPKTKIGENCNISQGVIIGANGHRGGAVIGDRVWIGPHAVITGPARVGSGAVIGANSSVVSNIPENSVAIGVPARIISSSGSSKLVKFPNCENSYQSINDELKVVKV